MLKTTEPIQYQSKWRNPENNTNTHKNGLNHQTSNTHQKEKKSTATNKNFFILNQLNILCFLSFISFLTNPRIDISCKTIS